MRPAVKGSSSVLFFLFFLAGLHHAAGDGTEATGKMQRGRGLCHDRETDQNPNHDHKVTEQRRRLH